MINTYKYKDETWIDIDHGTGEEIHEVVNTYNIHPFVAKELTSATPKPRIEFHDSYIYAILHFPVFKHSHSYGKSQEVDFVIGKNILITARYDSIDAFHKLSKELEVQEVLDKSEKEYTYSHIIFMRMLRGLYTSIFEELEYIEDTIENITSKIFKEKEREMVISISEMTRTLLDFKRITDLHHEILETLKHRGGVLFNENFSSEMEFIISDYMKINTTIKSNLEMLHELRQTDDSLLTAKQNEKMKQLTLIGSILLILGIIATLIA